MVQTTFVLHPSRRSRLTPWRNTGSVWAGPGLRRATVRNHAGAAPGQGLALELDRTQDPLRRHHAQHQEPGLKPSDSPDDGPVQETDMLPVSALVRAPDAASGLAFHLSRTYRNLAKPGGL